MSGIVRPCLDCGRASSHGSRCPSCDDAHRAASERARRKRRGTRTAQGYDNRWLRLSRAVLERDEYVCHYCGGVADTADHVIPKLRGGAADEANLVAACRPCNSRKGAR